MKKQLLSVFAVAVTASFGCGDEAANVSDHGSQDLDAEVAEALEAKGIQYQSLLVDKQARQAVIDGDIVMSLETLLAPAPHISLDEGLSKHPQGYSMFCFSPRGGIFLCLP